MSDFLNRQVTEARGKSVGSSSTWEALWKQVEEGTSSTTILFREKKFIGGNTFESSGLKELGRLRSSSENHGNIAVISFPEKIYNDQYRLYWTTLNYGSYLTGSNNESGNGMHLVCNSLASAAWKIAENSTDETRQNFISTVTWTSKFFGYMMDPGSKECWKNTKDAYDLLIKQASSQNLLRPISAMVVLGSMGVQIDRWSLLEKIFISVSRTYHDCGKNLAKADSLSRIFVYAVLLDLLCGIPLETVVTISSDDFVKRFSALEGDDKNLRVIKVLVEKILSNSSKESVNDISVSILTLMNPRKLKTLSKTEIQNGLSKGIVVEGKMLSAMDMSKESYFVTCANTKVNSMESYSVTASFSSEQWYTIAINIPDKMTSFSLDITGEFSAGSSGNPGVRIYSGPTVEWRKKGFQGLTSNGGRGDGFGAPTPLEGTTKVDLNTFKGGMKHLASVTFNKVGTGYDVTVKFDGWTQFHKIHHTDGNKILIAAKAFSVKVQMVNPKFGDDQVKVSASAATGGTTLSSLTSGSVLADRLAGMSALSK